MRLYKVQPDLTGIEFWLFKQNSLNDSHPSNEIKMFNQILNFKWIFKREKSWYVNFSKEIN